MKKPIITYKENLTYIDGYVKNKHVLTISSERNRIASKILIKNVKKDTVLYMDILNRCFVGRLKDLKLIAELIMMNEIAQIIIIAIFHSFDIDECIQDLEKLKMIKKFRKEFPREYGIITNNCGFRRIEKTGGFDSELKIIEKQKKQGLYN